jgi:hypothetical protein
MMNGFLLTHGCKISTLFTDMMKKNARHGSDEARKIADNYIDESAVRLTQRLKKAYLEEKKHAAKVRSYV